MKQFKSVRLLVFSIALNLFFAADNFAQQLSLDNVVSAQLRNTGEIIQGNEIVGYYLFYKVEAIDKKTNSFALKILDANLKETAKKEIVGSKGLYLIESTYNGKSLFFKFYDEKEKILTFYQYDAQANQKLMTTKKIDETEAAYLSVILKQTQGEIFNYTLHSVPSVGFVDYSVINNNRGYAIQFFPEDNTQTAWTYKNPMSGLIESAGFLAISNNMLLSLVAKKSTILSQQFTTYFLGIDITTGKKVFEVKLEDKKYAYSLINSTPDEATGDVILFGQYFNKTDNELKDPSLGLYSMVIDMKGNIKSKNYMSWATDVSKYLSVDAKGKVDGNNLIFFHKMLKTADGKIFAIGEQYRKAARVGAIALSMIPNVQNGMSWQKMVVEDLIIFEFDATNFVLQNVKIVEKTKNDYIPPSAGMILGGPRMLALAIKSFGGFDYTFTQTRNNNETFTIGYVDNGKKELSFNSLSYADGQFTTDKIALKSSKSSIRGIYPAKPGYLMITEYYKKEKKMELRLEKINY